MGLNTRENINKIYIRRFILTQKFSSVMEIWKMTTLPGQMSQVLEHI